MNNNKKRSLGKRYTARQIVLTEQLRLAVIERRANDEDTQKKNASWGDSLPPLPPEPKGNEKRVIVISKRGKAE
ncbi:hypothetical protein LCGC14_0665600 [marine sediment metagenome]|uniref:Uncharacterized protein n=1 Tax=marine sediment metagenome TaxID=412755 RepID=A0A0F9QXF3_9ZZZZ